MGDDVHLSKGYECGRYYYNLDHAKYDFSRIVSFKTLLIPLQKVSVKCMYVYNQLKNTVTELCSVS